MSENTNTASGGGIGFFGLLTVLFIALKLTHVINWSWWWVLSPTLIPLAIGFFFAAVALCLWIAALAIESVAHRR